MKPGTLRWICESTGKPLQLQARGSSLHMDHALPPAVRRESCASRLAMDKPGQCWARLFSCTVSMIGSQQPNPSPCRAASYTSKPDYRHGCEENSQMSLAALHSGCHGKYNVQRRFSNGCAAVPVSAAGGASCLGFSAQVRNLDTAKGAHQQHVSTRHFWSHPPFTKQATAAPVAVPMQNVVSRSRATSGREKKNATIGHPYSHR